MLIYIGKEDKKEEISNLHGFHGDKNTEVLD